MAPIPGLTEATIRNQAAPESLSRGQSYFRRGAVSELTLRGNQLQALVEGSQFSPYRVRVSFDKGGVTAASCSCPYDWGGWCKHIVAALLASRQADAIETRPPLGALLGELDRAQLEALLLGLAERDADMADTIERQVGLLRLASMAPQARAAGQARRSPIDQDAIRQQVRYATQPHRHGRYDDYDEYDYDDEDPGGEVVEALQPLLTQVRSFLEGGDARAALDILAALTDEYLASCRALADQLEEMYGLSLAEVSPGELFGTIGKLWAEALLSADLSIDERADWGERIAGLQNEADDLDVGDAFNIALAAAEQGWDYPPLQRALAGQIDDPSDWEGPAPAVGDELIQLRLSMLEHQGRSDEYLNLAKAVGQVLRYALMLAQLGRTAEAIETALQYLDRVGDAFALAKQLREHGDLEGAWRVAEHGLALPPLPVAEGYTSVETERTRADLAEWASELAAGVGQPERALRAAEQAFQLRPSLQGFARAQELAGPAWAPLRAKLLDRLRGTNERRAKVDIFLHEQLIDDAIQVIESGCDDTTLAQVADAAIAARPSWVIAKTTAQAERLMAAGDAQRYDQAVAWLRRARDAFRADGRPIDWQGYLEGARARYKRKHKLIGLLDKL